MSHPATSERVDEVRRALRRLLEILAHEVAQEIVADMIRTASTNTRATCQIDSNPSIDSGSKALKADGP